MTDRPAVDRPAVDLGHDLAPELTATTAGDTPADAATPVVENRTAAVTASGETRTAAGTGADEPPAVAPAAGGEQSAAESHVRRPLPRGRGRNWISKRWIYWKRRYSNPTRRDWVLLATLIWILLSAVVVLVSYRAGGLTLALGLAALAGIRAMPGPAGEMWVNRQRRTDIVTMLVLAVVLAGISLVVPSH